MAKMRAFIIDDSTAARHMLRRILADHGSFEIAGEAESALSGVIGVEEAQPDVVILEACIGGDMPANKIIMEIKRICPETAIVLSADTAKAEKALPLTFIGADDFFEKPLIKAKVYRTLNDIMRKKKFDIKVENPFVIKNNIKERETRRKED